MPTLVSGLIPPTLCASFTPDPSAKRNWTWGVLGVAVGVCDADGESDSAGECDAAGECDSAGESDCEGVCVTDGKSDADGECDSAGESDCEGVCVADGECDLVGVPDEDGVPDADGKRDSDGECDLDGDRDADIESDADGVCHVDARGDSVGVTDAVAVSDEDCGHTALVDRTRKLATPGFANTATRVSPTAAMLMEASLHWADTVLAEQSNPSTKVLEPRTKLTSFVWALENTSPMCAGPTAGAAW